MLKTSLLLIKRYFYLFLIRGAKLPTAPQNRRTKMDSDSPTHSPKVQRKLGTSVPLPTRATVVSSEVPVSRPQLISSQRSPKDRSGSMRGERSHAKQLIKGEGTPPKRFQRANSHSDFLKQVAEKLADRSTTTTVSGSESASPPDTPMLPTLSPTSSVATFVFVSTSDSSGLSSDDDEDHHRRRRSSSRGRGGFGTPKGRRNRESSLGSGMISLGQPDRDLKIFIRLSFKLEKGTKRPPSPSFTPNSPIPPPLENRLLFR